MLFLLVKTRDRILVLKVPLRNGFNQIIGLMQAEHWTKLACLKIQFSVDLGYSKIPCHHYFLLQNNIGVFFLFQSFHTLQNFTSLTFVFFFEETTNEKAKIIQWKINPKGRKTMIGPKVRCSSLFRRQKVTSGLIWWVQFENYWFFKKYNRNIFLNEISNRLSHLISSSTVKG